MRRDPVIFALIVVAGILAAAPGLAAYEKAITAPDTTLSDAEIERRIGFLVERLEDSKFHGQAWYWGWMTVNVVSTGANAYAASTFDDNHDDRVNAAVNAGVSLIGVADLLIRPLEARLGADPVRGLPEATRQQRIEKLRAAEDQLHRNAERAERRWSVADHAGSAGLALASGLTVGLWGNPTDGVVTGVSTLVGGWINLLTAPWEPENDWQEYRQSFGQGGDRTSLDFYVSGLAEGARAGVVYRW